MISGHPLFLNRNRTRLSHLSPHTDFFAAVSHDLRTPLASMQAATEALVDGVASDPDRYLASLQSDLGVMRALVDDLFLLARAEAGDVAVEFEPTDITEVVDETLEVMKPVADQRDVKLELVSDDRVVIDTSEAAVGRVLRNLVDNAVRHSPTGTTVSVGVTAVTDRRNCALITVTDQGSGFDAEFAERAFDSFTRSDSARTRDGGGAGLGLAIAGALVEVLGGRIWIEPGECGVVNVALPLSSSTS